MTSTCFTLETGGHPQTWLSAQTWLRPGESRETQTCLEDCVTPGRRPAHHWVQQAQREVQGDDRHLFRLETYGGHSQTWLSAQTWLRPQRIRGDTNLHRGMCHARSLCVNERSNKEGRKWRATSTCFQWKSSARPQTWLRSRTWPSPGLRLG